jgi:iron complex transport system permease protein
LTVALVLLLTAFVVGLCVGAAGLPIVTVLRSLANRLPFLPDSRVPALDDTILWQIRFPRVVLAGLVGAMLAGGGAAYQGVFRNPLADPYLLGVAAGGGLGATIVIIWGRGTGLLPPAAFAGAVAAVGLTYALGTARGRDPSSTAGRDNTSIVLAGVAVAALFTAVQTYLQQQHVDTVKDVYSWILGRLTLATWSDVRTIAPYVTVAAAVLLFHARHLDVLRVGEEEAKTLGVNPARLRVVLIGAATLGTAAAVAVSGLIGFVGIIVPHAVRLTVGAGYRTLMPVSMVGGAAFLILADVAARTAQSPAEVPIGVVTACVGAPFFLFVLRSRRAREGMS